jgi:hypothetical protein
MLVSRWSSPPITSSSSAPRSSPSPIEVLPSRPEGERALVTVARAPRRADGATGVTSASSASSASSTVAEGDAGAGESALAAGSVRATGAATGTSTTRGGALACITSSPASAAATTLESPNARGQIRGAGGWAAVGVPPYHDGAVQGLALGLDPRELGAQRRDPRVLGELGLDAEPGLGLGARQRARRVRLGASSALAPRLDLALGLLAGGNRTNLRSPALLVLPFGLEASQLGERDEHAVLAVAEGAVVLWAGHGVAPFVRDGARGVEEQPAGQRRDHPERGHSAERETREAIQRRLFVY